MERQIGFSTEGTSVTPFCILDSVVARPDFGLTLIDQATLVTRLSHEVRNEIGGGGIGSGAGGGLYGSDRVLSIRQVEQRVRVLSKPEPQYTDEARRNQIIGTVTLRVVFSRFGEVTNIRAIQSLPLGLTERAIAAARQIRFVPAMLNGQPVSVYMQLEYNFNLY